MQYILLINIDEAVAGSMTPDERTALMGKYWALTTDMREKGAFVAGDPLQPSTTATTVCVRDGQRLVTDGPFAETKEQLVGHYIVDAGVRATGLVEHRLAVAGPAEGGVVLEADGEAARGLDARARRARGHGDAQRCGGGERDERECQQEDAARAHEGQARRRSLAPG